MGLLSERLDDYKAGRITFEELKAFVAGFKFETPRRFWPDRPTCMGELEAFIDEHMDADPTDTWDEVSTAQARGLLTWDEYYALSEAMDAKR